MIKDLGKKRYWKLVELIGTYDRESERCAKVRAYYAACALQGAALEGLLLAMCDAFIDDVRTVLPTLPPEKRPKGPLTKWSLNDLIVIAKALDWLPSRKSKWAKPKLGDWTELVKELRNLVHPGRHINSYPKHRMRKGHYSDAYAILRSVTSHLWDRIEPTL